MTSSSQRHKGGMKARVLDLTAGKVRSFRKEIYRHYEQYGRDLPWRRTADPYCILVSEIMLQQTQVSRVIPKYLEFLNEFPTLSHLASANKKHLLTIWSGLGYNRRALWLKDAAEIIVKKGLRKVGLLGTKFTMEEDFYKKRLKERYDIWVIMPDVDVPLFDTTTIHAKSAVEFALSELLNV